MRTIASIALATILLTGCVKGKPKPVGEASPAEPAVQVETDSATDVEVGGPQGGVHVNDPAGGTKVDIDASGVHVKTPETQVDVP